MIYRNPVEIRDHHNERYSSFSMKNKIRIKISETFLTQTRIIIMHLIDFSVIQFTFYHEPSFYQGSKVKSQLILLILADFE